MVDLPLFQRFEKLSATISWISLGTYPTPIERLKNLEKALGLGRLWIKRDDVSGQIYGGNKVRTLEFSLAEALQEKAEVVCSFSAVGSNWPLACTIYSRLHGLASDVFYLPYPMDAVKRQNLEITQKLARNIYQAKSLFTFPFLYYSKLIPAQRRQRIYVMPPGGVSPVTTLGYVNAVLELKQQCDAGEMPIPDVIFCPLGSGGTAAGIAIGVTLLGWPTQVIAVRIVDWIVANRVTLGLLLRRTWQVLAEKGGVSHRGKRWGNLTIEHSFFGKGYARPHQAGERAVKLLHEHENQILDSTYTGKMFAAALEYAGKFPSKNILIWQTLNSRNLDSAVSRISQHGVSLSSGS